MHEPKYAGAIVLLIGLSFIAGYVFGWKSTEKAYDELLDISERHGTFWYKQFSHLLEKLGR